MDPELLALKRARARDVLVPLFLSSGATSLVYETLWSRELHLIVGTSQLAISTTLAAFMAGLAAGGVVASRVVHRARRPLVWYAALEVFIGLYALAFPWIMKAFTPLYLLWGQGVDRSPAETALFQLVSLGALLLPPTVAMGATLPLLARFAVLDDKEAGVQVGRLYGANTLGAVVGAGLAGFVLLPELGLARTTWLVASANLVLGAVAFLLGREAPEIPVGERAPAARAEGESALLWMVATLAGFASLLYEVSWFRVLVLTLGGSAYAFSLMLLAFLLGIGIGGWLGGPLADRAYARGGRAEVLRWLAGIQVLVAVLAWLTMFGYGELPYQYVSLFASAEKARELFWPIMLLLALGVTLPACLGMGAAFPFLVRAAVGPSTPGEDTGGPLGRLYGANTVGAILGAAGGGFLLLPVLHVTGSVLLAVSANLLAAALAFGLSGPTRQRLVMVVAGAFLTIGLTHRWPPPWDPLLMTSGMYKYVTDIEDRSRQGVYNYAVEPYDLLFYDEGLSAVVTVARVRSTGNIWLANNGKIDASSQADMPTQVLVAQLPFAFRPEARTAAVIGLASGVTAGSATTQPALTRIDIVELEPAVVEASTYFDEINNTPLADPRSKLYTNDGRNHIVLTHESTYDVIISEPSNPWLTGVSNLFTAEFFALGKTRLTPGGVWSQWVQMYGMDYKDLLSLLRTFSETYAHVMLFSTIEDADLVLVGSDAPLTLDIAASEAMIRASEAVAIDLAQVKVWSAYDLLALYHLDRDGILAQAGQTEINTDDNMRIEYSAPRHLYDDTSEENFLKLLHPKMVGPTLPLEALRTHKDFIELARAYARREDWLRVLLVLEADPAILSVPERARLVAGLGDTLRSDQDPSESAVEAMLLMLESEPADPAEGEAPVAASGEQPDGAEK